MTNNIPINMTPEEQIKYCIYYLENNIINENEINYYQGLEENKRPHGISNYYWQIAYNNLKSRGKNILIKKD